MSLFETNIINIHGSKGKKWLEDLPKIIDEISIKWKLYNLKPVENLSYDYVLSGMKDKQPIILKLSLNINNLNQEANALKVFKKNVVVEVLALENGALLLEHAIPGISLKSYFPEQDNEATKIAAKLIEELHKTPIPHQHKFPHLSSWLEILDKDLAIPTHYLEKARNLRELLLKTTGNKILLHGDLHHDNILQNGTDWLVIDPKGVIGEGAYEVASFIRNPIPDIINQHNSHEIINNRIEVFAEHLALDPKRIRDWCFVGAVLSMAWALEDRIESRGFLRLVEILD